MALILQHQQFLFCFKTGSVQSSQRPFPTYTSPAFLTSVTYPSRDASFLGTGLIYFHDHVLILMTMKRRVIARINCIGC
jgi:hypothetical protein